LNPNPGQIRFRTFPIMGIEVMSASTSHVFPRHTHDQYGIGVVDHGGHASLSDRGQVEAGPGSLICVNPGEVHDGRPAGSESRSWRILYLEPARMHELHADITEGAHQELRLAAPVFVDEPLRALFNRTFASQDPLECESALLLMIARLRAKWTLHSRGPGAAGSTMRARELIDSDPGARHTLTAMAAQTGLSRYQLLRGFVRETHLTPHAYVLQRRIALARRMIRQGLALAEVALATGFFDQSHLSHCFARQFGVSPRRYAAQCR
jgi:AraC-like DNA-binding protein